MPLGGGEIHFPQGVGNCLVGAEMEHFQPGTVVLVQGKHLLRQKVASYLLLYHREMPYAIGLGKCLQFPFPQKNCEFSVTGVEVPFVLCYNERKYSLFLYGEIYMKLLTRRWRIF